MGIAIKKATIRVSEAQLLSSIWYSDGSGATRWSGVGIDDSHDDWRITHVRLLAPPLGVEIDVERVEVTTVQGG